MTESINPKKDFIRFLDKTDMTYIEFDMGLIFIFDGDKVNIRQYHNDGTCLSSWVTAEEFWTVLTIARRKKIIKQEGKK